MTIQCCDCSNWRPRETDPKLAQHGLAICKIRSVTKGHTFSGIFLHDCDKFSAAPPEIAAARRAFNDRPPPKAPA